MEHVIDLNGVFTPKELKENGWRVVHRIGNGRMVLDVGKIILHRENTRVRQGAWNPSCGGWNMIHVFKEKIFQREVTVLNECVLEYLLAHPELIPENWKDKRVSFWGTIYLFHTHRHYRETVRALAWNENEKKWVSYMVNTDDGFQRNDFAATL